MENRYYASNIRRYINDVDEVYGGIQTLNDFITGFSCPKNPEVEEFLHKNAIEFTKRNQSVTYLVFDSCTTQLVGYFSLAIKPVSIKLDRISKTTAKKLARR